MKRLIFHGSVLMYQLFVGHFALHRLDFSSAVNPDVKSMERFPFRYLTGWNFDLLIFYFSLCVIEDLIARRTSSKSSEDKNNLRQFKSFVFTVFVFPYTTLVFTMFWSIFAFDRELVYPKAVDEVLPVWLNHALHTGIAVVVMIEMLMSFHWYIKRKTALIRVHLILEVYAICFLYTHFIDDVWIYPMFRLMNWTQRFLFFAVSHIFLMAFYLIGETLHSLIWREKIQKRLISRQEKSLLVEKLD